MDRLHDERVGVISPSVQAQDLNDLEERVYCGHRPLESQTVKLVVTVTPVITADRVVCPTVLPDTVVCPPTAGATVAILVSATLHCTAANSAGRSLSR